MGMEPLNILAVLTIFLTQATLFRLSRGNCTMKTVEDAKTCVAKAVPQSTTSQPTIPIIGGADMEALQRLCVNETYKDMTRCVRNVADECPSDVRNTIYKFIDIQLIENAWDRLCKRTHVYAKHVKCYKQQRKGLIFCMERGVQDTNKKTSKARSQDELLTILCGETEKEIQCRDNVLRGACGIEAAKIIVDYDIAAKPPACHAAILSSHTRLFLVAMIVLKAVSNST